MASPSIDELLARLDAEKRRIDAARPLPPATLQSLQADFVVRYAHETTALEGNTLDIYETKVVLEDGITIGGKTVREHLEVLNIRAALAWLESAAAARTPITVDAIQEMHRLVMRGILREEAGRYRRVPVYIHGAFHVPPNWIKVPDLMRAFGERLQNAADDHPVRAAAVAHIELVRIHPFIDGNGRTARLLTNLLLMRAGYPPALYITDQRRDYMQALDTATFRGDPEPFIRITIQAVDRMADRYLEMIRRIEEGRRQAPTVSETRHPRTDEAER